MARTKAAQTKAAQVEQLRQLCRKLEARAAELLADVTTLETAITAMRRRYPDVERLHAATRPLTPWGVVKDTVGRAREETT